MRYPRRENCMRIMTELNVAARTSWARSGARRLRVVLRDQAALPCPAMPLGTRFCWRALIFGIPSCVSTRRPSWLMPALTGHDVAPGHRRRADRRPCKPRGRSAHDRLIVLTGQRNPAALAIAARAPHLGDRVAHLTQVAVAPGLHQPDDRVAGGIVPFHAGRRAGTMLGEGLGVLLDRLHKQRNSPDGDGGNAVDAEHPAPPDGNNGAVGVGQFDKKARPHDKRSAQQLGMEGSRRRRRVARWRSIIWQVRFDHVGSPQWFRLAAWMAAHNASRAPVQTVRMGVPVEETGRCWKNSRVAAKKVVAHADGNKPADFRSLTGVLRARPAASWGAR